MPWKDISRYPRCDATCDVYLLHFSRPFGHARHYVGVTKRGIDERVAEHRSGNGARITCLARQAGIKLQLAKTWIGVPRYYELKLKSRGKSAICPICQAQQRWVDALARYGRAINVFVENPPLPG